MRLPKEGARSPCRGDAQRPLTLDTAREDTMDLAARSAAGVREAGYVRDPLAYAVVCCMVVSVHVLHLPLLNWL